ncbi:MAG: hypothetical protein EOP84_19480, partial [Verrucomicrobiaceae bacterium]
MQILSKNISSILLLGVIAAANSPAHAGTELDVVSGLALDSSLHLATSYDQNIAPSATSDIVFTAAGNYANNGEGGRFAFGTAMSAGSLNVLNTTTAITLFNGNSSTRAPITLSGGNSVSGNTADLLYVATGANLTISGFKADGTSANTVNLVLGTSGNFNVEGTALISAPIANGTTGALTANPNALTKTGAGTLTLAGASDFGTTGAAVLNVNEGTVVAGSATALPAGLGLRMNGGTLDLNGNDATLGSLAGLTGAITDRSATAG